MGGSGAGAGSGAGVRGPGAAGAEGLRKLFQPYFRVWISEEAPSGSVPQFPHSYGQAKVPSEGAGMDVLSEGVMFIAENTPDEPRDRSP